MPAEKRTKALKRTQIAALVCAALLIPFEFLYEPVSWALDPLFEGGFGYYGSMILCGMFRYGWIALTLLLTAAAVILLLVWRRGNRGPVNVNKPLTAAAALLPPLVCALVSAFGIK